MNTNPSALAQLSAAQSDVQSPAASREERQRAPRPHGRW